MTKTTIFEAIRLEHDRHRALMKGIQGTTGDSPERRRLFADLLEDTEAHAAAEERVFYSRLIENPDTRGKSAHSIEEHQAIRDLLSELQETDMSSSAWLRRFSELQEKLEHHMKEEEHGVFQLAGKVFSDKEKVELATTFQTVKTKELIK